MLIDRAFSTVRTIFNSSGRGNITPAEFDLVSDKAINEIYTDWMTEISQLVNRQNRGLINGGLENLPDQLRDKFNRYSMSASLAYNGGTQTFTLPSDLRYIDLVTYRNEAEIERCKSNTEFYRILASNLTTPTEDNPVYIKRGLALKVAPLSIINNVLINYLRHPLKPKYTYTVISGNEIFNPSALDFQDYDIDESELPLVISKICFYFGINLKEPEIVNIMNQQQQIENNNELTS